MNEVQDHPASDALTEGLVSIALRVGRRDEVYLRAVLEAYEGVGFLIGHGNGNVRLAAPPSQAPVLRALVKALSEEFPLVPLEDETAPKGR